MRAGCRRGRDRLLQALHATTASLLLLARAVGEQTCIRPLRSGLYRLVRNLGMPPVDTSGLYIRPMSSAWLRQHDAEHEKHGGH